MRVTCLVRYAQDESDIMFTHERYVRIREDGFAVPEIFHSFKKFHLSYYLYFHHREDQLKIPQTSARVYGRFDFEWPHCVCYVRNGCEMFYVQKRHSKEKFITGLVSKMLLKMKVVNLSMHIIHKAQWVINCAGGSTGVLSLFWPSKIEEICLEEVIMISRPQKKKKKKKSSENLRVWDICLL